MPPTEPQHQAVMARSVANLIYALHIIVIRRDSRVVPRVIGSQYNSVVVNLNYDRIVDHL